MFINKYSVEDKDKLYCRRFDLNVCFINYSLTRFLRKIKFVTDGTFSGIDLRIGMKKYDVELVNYLDSKSLYVDVPFDFKLYDKSDDTARCKYYFELIRTALYYASRIKNIPLEPMIGFLDTLEANNYTYKWEVKNLIDWERNLKFKICAKLSTKTCALSLQVINRKPKELLFQNEIVQIKPDEDYIRWWTKDICLEDEIIYFNDPITSHKLLCVQLTDVDNKIVDTKLYKKIEKEDLFYLRAITQLGDKPMESIEVNE